MIFPVCQVGFIMLSLDTSLQMRVSSPSTTKQSLTKIITSYEKCCFALLYAYPKLNDCTHLTLHVYFKGNITAVNGRLNLKGEQREGNT